MVQWPMRRELGGVAVSIKGTVRILVKQHMSCCLLSICV